MKALTENRTLKTNLIVSVYTDSVAAVTAAFLSALALRVISTLISSIGSFNAFKLGTFSGFVDRLADSNVFALNVEFNAAFLVSLAADVLDNQKHKH